MNNIEKLKQEFYRIKALGFVENTRPNNKDGGIGNTFEDLLGVVENNKSEADFYDFEIKSQRAFNTSVISLFTKAPEFPKGANSFLRETYGEVRDENHSNKKILYASVYGNRDAEIYSKYKMRLNVNRQEEKLELVIKDLEDKILTSVYWSFSLLEKSSKKLKNLFLVFAETKKEGEKSFCFFKSGNIYYNFDFQKFLTEIENGNIQFDIRIGVYNSGRNYGKTHDHGSGFRVKRENFQNLYSSFEKIE
ncbi:MvaI/BcnI family restriction endonuclease [Bergeyella zoohelcum]|uniref:MvaI/BcnI family restriction endonuclease n=1 Tax=Bergeyella zoohelcum TaxID=1015 RepID=UPI002A91C53B|nr:MvaI/BcnI family restriction endonuclease [Bergeyella zoohelcum]MDY6025127.1 MvaI/BcnI family restriction endonuclease [Bergeyella zoohelcum]